MRFARRSFNRMLFIERLFETAGLPGLNKAEVDKKLGIHEGWRYASGNALPRFGSITKLALVGGVLPDYLLGLVDVKMPVRKRSFPEGKFVFCARLQRRMRELVLSQVELSILTSISQDTINDYYNGYSLPNAEMLFRLCIGLDCPASYLLGFIDERGK